MSDKINTESNWGRLRWLGVLSSKYRCVIGHNTCQSSQPCQNRFCCAQELYRTATSISLFWGEAVASVEWLAIRAFNLRYRLSSLLDQTTLSSSYPLPCRGWHSAWHCALCCWGGHGAVQEHPWLPACGATHYQLSNESLHRLCTEIHSIHCSEVWW